MVGVEVDGVEGLEGVSDGVSEGVDGLEGSLGVGCSGSGISRVVCTYGVTVTSPMIPNSWVRSVLMFARLEVQHLTYQKTTSLKKLVVFL